MQSSLHNDNDCDEDDNDDDDGFKRILLPVLSSTISPLRPSITCSSYRDTNQYNQLFFESCVQIREQLAHRRWPFCPIYLLHINTYCHVGHFAIPAEIALVETTLWPQLYGNTTNVQSMKISRKVTEHYERYSNLYKRFSTITDDFHDFVHPGDQLPTGYQADILEHSRRTHGLPCTPNEKIGTQDYNQLLDDIHEMLGSLCDFRNYIDNEPMPMFCTMESFWSTKVALDWIYDQPTTRDRMDDYTLYPLEALIAVIYESFYSRAQFKCDLGVLMGKTPQQPVLHSRACDYHGILENKYCAMAHVRDLSEYYISLMAYLYYTYCDHNSSTLLPYIKVTYHGSLSLQQEAYWSGKQEEYKKIKRDKCLSSSATLLSPSLSSDGSLNDKSFADVNKIALNSKGFDHHRPPAIRENSESDLNPFAKPFNTQTDRQETTPHSSSTNHKTPAHLIVFEPRSIPSCNRSDPITYQRIHPRSREDWDQSDPTTH